MTTFTYTKPTVGGSEDAWGDTLNANWDAIAAFIGPLDSTELAVLDGITASTAELNLLDGVTVTLADITATAAEINYLSGVTSAVQDQIDNIPAPPELTQAQVEDDTSTVFGQVSGQRLGQAVAANAQDSIVLLGTLTTTSGSSHVLSGLTLTPYKELRIAFDDVTPDSGDVRLDINGTNLGTTSTDSAVWGYAIIDLTYGHGLVANRKQRSGLDKSGVEFVNSTGISPATTSLTFDWSSFRTFTNGEIKVYGVR